MTPIDTRGYFDNAGKLPRESRRISSMCNQLVANEILKIASEIRELVRGGAEIMNLTIGDFSSAEFPVPARLIDGIKGALDDGQTNYPPAPGVLECREAVRTLFRTRLGIDYPLESVLIASGARPMLAGAYLATVNPGDRVVYPMPSWNNNHYCTVVGAERVEVDTTAEGRFFPRIADIEPHLSTARLVCLCSPLNPTGTVMDPIEMEHLSHAIVDENERRTKAGERPLYLLFDQVYWMLTFRDALHTTPVSLVPQMASYTIIVDGISKAFAATGLRVGWAAGPPDVMERMSALSTHMGAWAPRPEQLATARLLTDTECVDGYRATMQQEVLQRLDALAEGVQNLRTAGLDVEAIPPAGAIYLSMRLGVAGKKTPDGEELVTDDDIRSYVLREANVGLVPFTCFGVREGTNWVRASVGAVSVEDCERAIVQLGKALEKLE